MNKQQIENHFSQDPLHEFLITYTKKRYNAWHKKYLNVVGVTIGNKNLSDNAVDRYAIIFHVIDKTDSIIDSYRIPKHFTISYNGNRIKILTDVIKTGASILQYISPGQNISQFTDQKRRGTIGCIVIKDNQPHLLTNMHVIGWSYLFSTKKIIDKPINLSLPTDTSIQAGGNIKPAAYFRSGCVNEKIDAAIALIPDSLLADIDYRYDLFTVDDPIILPAVPVTNPIVVKMLGNQSGFKTSSILSTTAIKSFSYPFGTQTIINLIAMPYCSVPGDSGSVVFEPNSKRIIGIVLGADDEQLYTYVIPYYLIKTELNIY